METFGRECFKYCAKFDFDRQPELKSVFQRSKSPQRILKELALYTDVPIIAGKTLIIFDEIQECEEALNSLKYFYEDAPDYHVIAAGSLLGVAVRRRSMTVPVGKVRIMRMYPITFREFLRASDRKTYDFVDNLQGIQHLPEIIFNKLKTEYRKAKVLGEQVVLFRYGNSVYFSAPCAQAYSSKTANDPDWAMVKKAYAQCKDAEYAAYVAQTTV